MTTAKETSIVAAYLDNQPVGAIAKAHGVVLSCVYKVLKKHRVGLRGSNGRSIVKQQVHPAHFWDGFLIRPTLKDAERDRAKALRMIKPSDLNPNFYK